MTPGQIDRVFGRGRLKMVTGEHVEVYREAVGPGERRRYTKRFLNTPDGDFGHFPAVFPDVDRHTVISHKP